MVTCLLLVEYSTTDAGLQLGEVHFVIQFSEFLRDVSQQFTVTCIFKWYDSLEVGVLIVVDLFGVQVFYGVHETNLCHIGLDLNVESLSLHLLVEDQSQLVLHVVRGADLSVLFTTGKTSVE